MDTLFFDASQASESPEHMYTPSPPKPIDPGQTDLGWTFAVPGHYNFQEMLADVAGPSGEDADRKSVV